MGITHDMSRGGDSFLKKEKVIRQIFVSIFFCLVPMDASKKNSFSETNISHFKVMTLAMSIGKVSLPVSMLV